MKKGLMVLLAVLGLIGITVLMLGGSYNDLVRMDEGVSQAWAQVENVYQRRLDLIPNLVETVKGYAAHEKDTFIAVTEARSRAAGTLSPDAASDPQKFKQFADSQAALSSALSRLLVVVEKYPDLKANQNFRDLQTQLEGTENRITVARKRYIDSVSTYNQGIRHFPTNLTAKFLLGLKVRETFSISEEAKQVPKVNFNP
jgi:LemA protein